MYDIMLDGLMNASPPGMRCRAALKTGDSGYGGGVAPSGDTQHIIVTNVISRAEHTIPIGGSLCDSILSTVIYRGLPGSPVTITSGPEFVRNVTITNAGDLV